MTKNMQIIQKIYSSKTYIFLIIIIALLSIFYEFRGWAVLGIYALFVLDLLIGSILWFKTEPDKTARKYFKRFTPDILACIPIVEMNIFKIFRLFRLVRLTKLASSMKPKLG